MLKKLLYTFLGICISTLWISCSTTPTLNNPEQEWLRQSDSITVALFPYYPPYQFINDQGKIDGIFIEYLNLLEQKIGYKFAKKEYTNWVKLVNDAKTNNIDIILEIQKTEERRAHFNFYAKFLKSPHVMVTRKDISYRPNLKNVSNEKITVPEEYAIHEILKKEYPKLNIITEEDDLTCLKKLNSGTYDIYIGPKAVANYFIKSENLNNLIILVNLTCCQRS